MPPPGKHVSVEQQDTLERRKERLERKMVQGENVGGVQTEISRVVTVVPLMC